MHHPEMVYRTMAVAYGIGGTGGDGFRHILFGTCGCFIKAEALCKKGGKGRGKGTPGAMGIAGIHAGGSEGDDMAFFGIEKTVYILINL